MNGYVSRRPPFLALLVLGFGLTGCGGESPASVSGTVTLKGAPPKVSGLVISFMAPSGAVVIAPISADGKYTATGLPSGEMRVGFALTDRVEAAGTKDKATADPADENARLERISKDYDKQLDPRQKSQGKTANRNTKVAKAPIPERYLDPLKSGITTTLKLGDNVFDVDIK